MKSTSKLPVTLANSSNIKRILSSKQKGNTRQHKTSVQSKHKAEFESKARQFSVPEMRRGTKPDFWAEGC